MFKVILLLLIIFSRPLLAMDAMQQDGYVLQVGQKGVSRMEFRYDLVADATKEHLEKIGSLKGKKVLDLGCGAGCVTVDLAKRVGSAGHVWAVDISTDQLEQAKERVVQAGLNNVTFIQDDAKTLKNLSNIKFDVVYISLVFAHILPQDHKGALSRVMNVLEESGVVLSVEPIMSTFYEPCNHEMFVQYRNAGAIMGEKTGYDYDLGNRLKELYEEAGFSEVEGYFRQPKITSAQAMKLFSLDIPEWEAGAIALGVFTQEQLNGWKSTIAAWPKDDSQPFHTGKFAYVVARK